MRGFPLNQALSKSLRSNYIGVSGAYRFRCFQAWLLNADLPKDLHTFLALFAFDGMQVKDCSAAIKGTPVVYLSGKVGLSWNGSADRLQRLRLSPITISLLRDTSWNRVQNFSIEALEEVYRTFSGRVRTLDHFSSDQLAWFSEISSGPLFEHFCGRILMTALPDGCYIRCHTKQAVLTEVVDSDEESEHILSIALNGFFEPIGHDRNPLIIDRLLKICHRKRIDDNSKHKKWMLQQCLALAEQSADFGAISSLILSWACDLIGHGTGSKTNISVSTIVNYVGVLAKPVFLALRQQDIADWEASTFELMYRKLIEEASLGQKRNMASAINSWHRFLVNWLDIPPITKRLHDDISETSPQANVVWEHEYKLIQEWLVNAKTDERLVMYLQAMFCVAYNIRIRINELLKLKLSDIDVFTATVKITIRGTKSIAAKRRVEVQKSTVSELLILIQRRHSESALSDDLLFADPNRINKVYQLSKLYSYSNQLLKAVTGDRKTRFHALSHTVISQKLSKLLLGGTVSLTNPFHQTATDVAHFSILTSCSEYVHCYEDAVRETINRGLQDLIITSGIASRWSAHSPEAIRKRLSRSGANRNSFYWEVIFENINTTDIAVVSDGYQLALPEKPKFLSESNQLGFAKVLSVFCDLYTTIPHEKIALRQSLDAQKIRRLLQQAKSVIIKGGLCKRVNFNSSIDEVSVEIRNLIGVDFNKVRQKKLDKISTWLLRDQFSDETLKAAAAWLILQKSGYISLPPDANSRNFICVLSKMGVPITHVAIACSPCTTQNDLLILQSIFYEAYGTTVPKFIVEQRRSRPNIYLLFNSSRVRAGVMPKPACTSLAGLNAFLFIMLIIFEGAIIDGI